MWKQAQDFQYLQMALPSSIATATPKVLRDGDLTLLIEGKESL
jgi:hypothetical protein